MNPTNTFRFQIIPDKRNLELGTTLVFEFARRNLPDQYDEVRAIFRKAGAYARYKALLASCDLLERWHEFSHSEEEKALREWCQEHGIILDE